MKPHGAHFIYRSCVTRGARWLLLATGMMLSIFPLRALDGNSIIVISPGNGQLPGLSLLMSGFRKGLSTNLAARVVTYGEYLNSDLMDDPDYQDEMVRWMRLKYRSTVPLVLVALDEQSAEVTFKIRDQLWPKVPVLFIDRGNAVEFGGSENNATSISINTDAGKTLQMALQLFPHTKHVAFISAGRDISPEFYQYNLRQVRGFADGRFDFIDLSGLAMSDLTNRLAKLPPQTVVYFDGTWSDPSGQILTPRDAIERFSENCRAPIFSCGETFFGAGALGGSCTIYNLVGAEASKQVAAIITASGNADAVPPINSFAKRWVFDWQQLRRFHLSEKDLPPDSDVRLRHQTIWTTYRNVIVIAGAIVFAQSVMIVLLLVQRRRARKAEEELSGSQRTLRTVLDAIPQRVFWKDRNSVFLGCNQQLAKDCGFSSPEEVVGKTDYDAITRSNADQYRADDARVIQSGKPKLNYEELQMRAGGQRYWLRTNKVPMFDDDGKVIGVLGTYEDITALKEAQEASRQSEQRFRTLTEASFEGICISEQGRILDVNDQFCAIFGYSRDELIGREIYSLIAPKSREEVRMRISTAHEGAYEHECLRKDGSTFPAEALSRTVLQGGRQIRLSSIRDLTERKRLEEQLRQSQKMEAFGQLAAGVAHDFNNILTVVQGNLSLLRMGLNSKADETSAIDQAIAASERAGNLTRQLLTFGRRQPMRPRALDLNDVISNLTKMLQRIIGEDISLQAHYAPGGAPVLADINMMEQALINLAVNSRDAMPNGGKLMVEIRQVRIDETPPGPQRLRSGDFIQLSVSDTGCGISAEDLPHIFEPFFTTKDVGKGTGLGLATVFGIVQQHDGWITVESERGKGSTFHIFLPRHADSISVSQASSVAPGPRGGSENILIVEDELPVRNLMRVLLTRAGYKVHEAASGAEALNSWGTLRDRIELLITDMVMPGGVSGHELGQRLSADKPGLKVIYCSGYSDEMLGKNSSLRSNAHFLEKPFEPQEFLKRVRNRLDER